MADLEYFVVCRSVAIDVDTDEITLCNVLEDLFPSEFPELLDRAVAISTWRIPEEEKGVDFQAILKIYIPGDETGEEFPMNFAQGTTRPRAIQSIINIPLERAGTLVFKVFLNGKESAAHHIEVHPEERVERISPELISTDSAQSALREESP